MPDRQRPLLHLHGRPRLVRPGAAAQPLQPDGRHRLLLLLALQPDGLDRAQVCALLWPDAQPALARSRLRKLVFLLAKDPVLEEAPLDADGVMLGWRVDSDLRQADTLERQGALAQALALTAPPLAEGFDDGSPFGAWLLQRRQRERLRWRERLARALAPPASLPDAQALAWIDDALMHEPFDEPLVRERLRLIARRDGPVAARLAYEQWSDAVREEFGQGAGFDLAPLLAHPPLPVPGPLPQPASRFFGRVQELAMLDTHCCPSRMPPQARHAWCACGARRAPARPGWRCSGRGRRARAGRRRHWSRSKRWTRGLHRRRPTRAATTCWRPASPAPAAGVLGDGAQPVQGLLQHLRERPGLVLVIDNIDHRLGDRPLVERLLHESPVRLLVASRTRLGLAGETMLAVGGLALAPAPESGDALSDAECLMIDRAGLPAAPDGPTRQRLQELGRLAQGQPLALELAARQARRLGLATALQRLQHDIAALEAVEPDLPARQRSLRATFDSVLATLAPDEREAMERAGPAAR
jgi:DNA-binding SARP family transcriptional activator